MRQQQLRGRRQKLKTTAGAVQEKQQSTDDERKLPAFHNFEYMPRVLCATLTSGKASGEAAAVLGKPEDGANLGAQHGENSEVSFPRNGRTKRK